MNSTSNHEPPATAIRGVAREKCVVCGDLVGERCFCRIYRKQGEPVVLCCPSCSLQYFESARPPANAREEELLKYEKAVHLFVGEEKPWQ